MVRTAFTRIAFVLAAAAASASAAARGGFPDAFEQQVATASYAQAMEHRQAGNDLAAYQAFLEAAMRGHARAQLRLARIYDRGNAVVARDYVEAIRWFQKARENGAEIEMPLRRTFGVVGY